MTCSEIKQALAKQFDDSLALTITPEMAGHVEGCEACEAYAQRLALLSRQIVAHRSIPVPSRSRRRKARHSPRGHWGLRFGAALALGLLLVTAFVWRPGSSPLNLAAESNLVLTDTHLDGEPAQTIIYQLPEDQNTTIVWVYR